jgi:hypothetical protein
MLKHAYHDEPYLGMLANTRVAMPMIDIISR